MSVTVPCCSFCYYLNWCLLRQEWLIYRRKIKCMP